MQMEWNAIKKQESIILSKKWIRIMFLTFFEILRNTTAVNAVSVADTIDASIYNIKDIVEPVNNLEDFEKMFVDIKNRLSIIFNDMGYKGDDEIDDRETIEF